MSNAVDERESVKYPVIRTFDLAHIETCSRGSGFGPPKPEKETLREEKEFPLSTGPEQTRTSEEQQQQQQPLRPSLSFEKIIPVEA